MEKVEPQNHRFRSAQSADSDGSPLLELSGELDMLSAVNLRNTVEGLVEHGCERIVFDLNELDFMDSSGIAVFIYAANNIETIELRNASAIIKRIIEVTGLSNFLKLDSA